LAEALGATRNVTREAIKVLAAMGRLTVRRGAGMFVAASGDGAISDDLLVHFQPTDIEQVVMLLDHRRLIESETARRASRLATPIEVKGIRNAALASVEKSTSSNVADFGEADAHFHKAVAAAAHNVFLESSMATLRKYVAQSDLLLFHGDVAGSVEVAAAQHVAIADAIADGEPQLAASLMIDHINTTQAQFERRIKDRFSTFIRTDETPS
jgi:DNA-binding FadR family transcriptional regulator